MNIELEQRQIGKQLLAGDDSVKARTSGRGNNLIRKKEPEITIAQHLLALNNVGDSMGGECRNGFPCFYSFTKLCKHTNSEGGKALLYSGMCKFHNITLFNRQFFEMPIPGRNETGLMAIPVEEGNMRNGFPLYSLMKQSTKSAEFAEMFSSTSSFNTGNLVTIWSFMATLSTPINSINKDPLAISVQAYISSYLQEVIPILKKMQNLKQIIVEINFNLEEYKQQLEKNFWLKNIVTKELYSGSNLNDKGMVPDGETVSLRIPLDKFLIPDIWAILGYGILPINTENNLIGSVKIFDYGFFMGVPAPLTSTIYSQEPALKNACRMQDYETEIIQSIFKDVKQHANYDLMYLSAWYVTTSTSYNPYLPIPVHFATYSEWTNVSELAINHVSITI